MKVFAIDFAKRRYFRKKFLRNEGICDQFCETKVLRKEDICDRFYEMKVFAIDFAKRRYFRKKVLRTEDFSLLALKNQCFLLWVENKKQ